MTSIIRSLLAPRTEAREAWPVLSMDDWVKMFSFGSFPFGFSQTIQNNREEIEQSFSGYVQGAYRSNGIVFACSAARQSLFSEARFLFQQMRNGMPGDFFGSADLALLETPEPGQVTGDLLTRAISDIDFAGNCFLVRRPNRIKRMRPDWVSIVLGSTTRGTDISPYDIDAEVLGYIYQPGGPYSDEPAVSFAREEVAHFRGLTPDPLGQYRGMSWVTALLREIEGDSAASLHKLNFFRLGATSNMVVTLNPVLDPVKAKAFADLFEQEHSGTLNAYRTIFLGGGSDVKVVGSNFSDLDYKAVQGMSETRIAAAAGVHPTVVGLSEGLQGSSLNAGNFEAAIQLTADKTLRPLWRNFAGSISTIIPPPPGSRMWYYDKDVPFLKADIKDAAQVRVFNAQSISQLVQAGFQPDTAVDAVVADDYRRLRQVEGLTSVQLQPLPNPDAPPVTVAPAPQPPPPPARSIAIRCPSCEKLLAEGVIGFYRNTCPRCKATVEINTEEPVSIRVTPVPQLDTGPMVEAIERLTARLEPREPVINVSPSPPPQVLISEGAVQIVQHVLTRTVMERDPETGRVVATYEERLE
jgi:phage FluMu protein Com/phage portal protein BeeE